MNASLLVATGLMLGAVAAPAQTRAKIEYRTPVSEATPLGFTLRVQSRPGGGAVCYVPPSPSVVIVSSGAGSAYHGAYYVPTVVYGNGYRGRLNVSGYRFGPGYGRPFGWTGGGFSYGARLNCGTVAGVPSCVRTVVAQPCVY